MDLPLPLSWLIQQTKIGDIFLIFPPKQALSSGVLLMYTQEGVSSVANFITAFEESQ